MPESTDQQTNRAKPETLAGQYRAIGPAAIMAALLYARRKPMKRTAFMVRAA